MQRTLPLNFLLIFLLLQGLLFGGLVLSQENEAPGDTLEQHDTKDLEELLKRYNKDQVKVIEDNSKIHNLESSIEDSEIREIELENAELNSKVARFGKKKKADRIKPKEKLSDSVRLVLQPLQKLSDKELESLFFESLKSSKLRPYYEKFPQIATFSVGMIKDKEAIPSLVSVVEDRPRLMNFVVFMMSTILVGFFLKKLFFKKERSFLGLIFFFFIRMSLMTFLRFGIIYYFFSKEFSPASVIFKKVFL